MTDIIERDGIRFTPWDIVVFTFRPRFFGYWKEAEDFADALLAALDEHGYRVVDK